MPIDSIAEVCSYLAEVCIQLIEGNHSLRSVGEGTSYGTAALKVRGKLFVRLKEDGDTIVLRTDSFERDHLLATAPATFFITDHYRDYPWVLVRLATVRTELLRELLEDAWRHVAPKKIVTEWNVTHAN